MIGKKELVLTLYELSMLISPGDPEKLLTDFGKTVLRRFNFSCFCAEVPVINLNIRIPEKGEFQHCIEFSGKILEIRFCRDEKIPPEYFKALKPLLEKLDYTLEYTILSKEKEDMLRKAPDVVLFLDKEEKIVEMNEAARNVLGDIVGEKLPDECRGEICEHDGRIYSIQTYETFTGSIVVGRDITDRVRLERELKEREQLFRTLSEVSPAGIIVHQKGKIVFANDMAERLTGYSKEELTEMSVWDIIHPDYRKTAEEMLKRRVRGERPVYELKIVRKDGKERWVLVSGSVMIWKGKQAIIVACLDITARKILEDKIKESEELFRSIFNRSPVAQCILVDGRFELVNSVFERLLGYSVDELIGKCSIELVHPDDREKVRENAIKMLKGERTQPYSFRVVRKDGKILWAYETVIPIRYKGKRAVLGFGVDITDLETERKKLKELTEMLELINKTLRHDVLNALTSAVAYLEMALEEENREYAEKAMESVRRAVSIVKNMRAFEKAVKSGELKCVDVREIAEEVAKNFGNVEVYGEGRALADDGLRSVFENIIQNAVIHSGTDKIKVTIEEGEDYCEIRVADYGRGVPEEIKHRIFEEGFKYGETGQTGLGLFIVRKIVKRYGGEIWVEDNRPRGSVFVVRLRKC